jgi:hypothetical protein
MSRLGQLLILTAAIVVAFPAAAVSDPTAEERAENVRKVDEWRKSPELFARLRADARAFLELPPGRQVQLCKLDQDLNKLPSSEQAHLLEVGKRYADWLERLPEADRQKIDAAPDQKTRLQRIQALREQEWIRLLPRKRREEVEKAQGASRAELIRRYRREERFRRRAWEIAFRHWDDLIKKKPLPSTLRDFPPEVQSYVNEYLRPWLTNGEKGQLDRADGNWPAYPRTLVRLADKHPMALKGDKGPTHFWELPTEVQGRLQSRLFPPFKMGPKGGFKGKGTGNWTTLKNAEGKWPEYAAAVTSVARVLNVRLPHELWPSQPDELSGPVRQFLNKRLIPLLDEQERKQLKDAEWKWPQYPETIKELAQRHKLQVPWQTLPWTRDWPPPKWASYRLRPIRSPGQPLNPALAKP